MTTVTAPITIARQKLMSVIAGEFQYDNFVVLSDRLHPSLGGDGITRIGVSPQQEVPMPRDHNTLQFGLLVQFYGAWDEQIDPLQTVDPTPTETYGERFKRALRNQDPNQSSVWFFNLVDLTYPPDPTGNITRWEARITAYGQNSATLLVTG